MRIISKWIFERLDGGGTDWINLTQDRDRLQALVNTVLNFQGSIKCEEFLD
jgi:hypothetical protein